MKKNKVSVIRPENTYEYEYQSGHKDNMGGYSSYRRNRAQSNRIYNHMYTPFITQLYTQYDSVKTKSLERSHRREQADLVYNKTLKIKSSHRTPRPKQDVKA